MAISPNMSLTLPGVGVTPGPDWAQNLNADLSKVDSHDHSPGNGVLITPSGLNINADLTFNSKNATSVRSLRLVNNNSNLALVTDVNALYVANGDLWYNNAGGSQIRLTIAGSIAGTSGNISGLVSPASASYNGGSSTFVWQSNTATSAKMDAGSFIMRNDAVMNSFGLTISVPSLAADKSLVLPLPPVSKKLVTVDPSGNMVADTDVDDVTLERVGNVLAVKDDGINTAQIADGAVTLAKLNFVPAFFNYQVFNYSASAQTFVVPADVNVIFVALQGGGGGGGSGGSNTASTPFGTAGGGGGGGSAGELITKAIQVTPGQTISVITGAGGAPGPINQTVKNYASNGGSTYLIINGTFYVAASGGAGGGNGYIRGAGLDTLGGEGGRVIAFGNSQAALGGDLTISIGQDAIAGGIFGSGGGGGFGGRQASYEASPSGASGTRVGGVPGPIGSSTPGPGGAGGSSAFGLGGTSSNGGNGVMGPAIAGGNGGIGAGGGGGAGGFAYAPASGGTGGNGFALIAWTTGP